MSTRIIKETDCDRCGTKSVAVKSMRVATGRDLDPAGGASEEAGVCFDLCANCLAALFQQMVLQEFKTYEAAKIWIDWLKLKNHNTW